LIKQGPGTLALGAASPTDGRTEIHAGTLRLEHPAALSRNVIELHKNATLEITTEAAKSLHLGGLHGPGSFTPGACDLTLGHDNPADCYGAELTGALTGRGTLIKRGASAQSFAGRTEWTGPINVLDGELDIDGSLKHEGALTVAAGASLGGRGTIDNASPLHIAGTLRPGSQFSPAGVLTIAGDLVFEAGSRCVMTIGQRKGRWDHTHSRLIPQKDVDLSAATLMLRIDDVKFEPKAGSVIVLVNRGGGASRFGQVVDETGQAQPAIEGARVQLVGRAARLTYQADGAKEKAEPRGGHDVAVVFE
jgi:autotransporter-associated beta strand protein